MVNKWHWLAVEERESSGPFPSILVIPPGSHVTSFVGAVPHGIQYDGAARGVDG